MWVEVIAS